MSPDGEEFVVVSVRPCLPYIVRACDELSMNRSDSTAIKCESLR